MFGIKKQLDIKNITPENLSQAKSIIRKVFPVAYSENFYKDVLSNHGYSKLAYLDSIPFGVMCCKPCETDGINIVYITVLGCLVPYRGQGFGTALLNEVYLLVKNQSNKSKMIRLHVQSSNELALSFYRKHGFKIIKTENNYYRRLKPSSAFMLQKIL